MNRLNKIQQLRLYKHIQWALASSDNVGWNEFSQWTIENLGVYLTPKECFRFFYYQYMPDKVKA